MNPSKLYVPNPQKWVQFFDKAAKGKVNWNQTGGGNISQIMSMDKYVSSTPNKPQLPVKIVSPAEQVVDQVKSELMRENIKPSEVKKIFHKPRSRPRKQPSKKKYKTKSKKVRKIKKSRTNKKSKSKTKSGRISKQHLTRKKRKFRDARSKTRRIFLSFNHVSCQCRKFS
jgi:hypothetical protein